MRESGYSLAEYEPELELHEALEAMRVAEPPRGVFAELEELELAAELLEVGNEQELELFLGRLIKRAGRAIGKFARSPVGRAVGGILKGIAKKALPAAAGALGTFVDGPIGASIGSGLARVAGKAMGLELEGLSQEDREFEAARHFVRFAGHAIQNAVTNPGSLDPEIGANMAATVAARHHAPGLLRVISPEKFAQFAPADHPTFGLQGRWRRHGRRIVVFNA